MKWNIYQPPILITLAMSLLCSCQSNVQEDNTAYERFKEKKLKEKEEAAVPFVASVDTVSEPTEVVHKKTGAVTARANHMNTFMEDVSDDVALAEPQPSAQTPQEVHKAEVNRTVPSTEAKKKLEKNKKAIVWPKINKITLKKKKKDKKEEYATELAANRK